MRAIILAMPKFKVGDMPPDGYLQKEEWWHVQKRGGLTQELCSKCSKYIFPQQVASTGEVEMKTGKGESIKVKTYTCIACELPNHQSKEE